MKRAKRVIVLTIGLTMLTIIFQDPLIPLGLALLIYGSVGQE